ncbi:MAG: D-cysteine desulfhydrase family protein [Bacillota bacterium]|nr:D-cysteine desulfhydrase family protein [Bacillota bacterium]
MFLKDMPRVKLAALPTVLEYAPRLSQNLGLELYIKRDDNTGLAVGGNKARKLEYLVGDALAKGCDTLITTGGPQSNHCRMTAAAAAKSGLDCHLVFTSQDITVRQGNLLLDELLGANIHFLGSDDGALAGKRMIELAEELKQQGKTPYIVPLGGSSPVGAAGYIRAIKELVDQTDLGGISVEYIVHASGSAGTQAGLLAGVKAFNLPIKVLGISVSRPKQRLSGEVLDLCRDTLSNAGFNATVTPEEVVVYDEYVGGGYGIPTELSTEALKLFAKLEGIIIDPVYTAKAGAGLLDLTRRGIIPQGSSVLFWHTGGSPALFAEQDLHWRPRV